MIRKEFVEYMYKKRIITKDTIMGMTPNMCIQLFQDQQREIERLSRLVEKQGKKCHKYQRMLAAAHFGGEDKIPSKKKSPDEPKSRHTFEGSGERYGYDAYFEDNKLVIEYWAPREGGVLYQGEWRGEDTPYLNDIKQENPRMYNSIMKFFADNN
jgi:hypothetical protein